MHQCRNQLESKQQG